mgnify:FL=1
MIKKLFLLVVLLAGTAVTVLFGEGFLSLFEGNIPTSVPVTETVVNSPTQTMVFSETLEPTFTAEATATPLPTATLDPTPTIEFTATASATEIPTETATPQPTPTFELISDSFKFQEGSPVYMPNFVHIAEGCAWQGVAGQVFGTDGKPMVNYVLRLTGTFNGVQVNQIGLTGSILNTPYGPGSYEFILGNTAIDSENQLFLQLFTHDGNELTNLIPLTTYSSCSKNLEILNFQQK